MNFDRIDKILQTAYDNGLGLRGHTLLWHSQTPAWFFGIDYDADEDAVDEDTMDARIDFYVSTVMDHVMQKEKEIAGETGKIGHWQKRIFFLQFSCIMNNVIVTISK